MLKRSGLTSPVYPKSIPDSSILVNNDSLEGGTFLGHIGANTISFSYLPENAEATKSIILDDNKKYASVDQGLILIINNECPSNTYIHIDLIAKPITKAIKIIVKRTYHITFQFNSGNDEAVEEVQENALAPEPTRPYKEGYIFDGWYRSPLFEGSPFDFNLEPIKSDLTLYAKWLLEGKGYFSLIVNVQGKGTVTINNQKYSYKDGTLLTLTASPDSGYMLRGWYVSNKIVSTDLSYSFSMVENTTILAVFDIGNPPNGDGTKDNPFLISSPTDLEILKTKDSSKTYFRLANNLDFSTYFPWNPVENFKGNLDGNNKVIKNMKISYGYSKIFNENDVTVCCGLVNILSGSISNLVISNMKINVSYSERHQIKGL